MTKGQHISTEDAERFLSGGQSPAELRELDTVAAALRAGASMELDAALIERIATRSAAVAADVSVSEAASRHTRTRGSWLRRRVATTAAAATLLLGSGAGLAIAADGAAPGDTLFGLDRAFEAVGIGDGGAEERLREVKDLVADGQLARGLEHARAVVAANHDEPSKETADAARQALRAAAARVSATASAVEGLPGEEVQAAVADLLTYLSVNVGHVDVETVAGLSHVIGEAARAEHGPLSQSQSPGKANPPGNPNPGPPSDRGAGRP